MKRCHVSHYYSFLLKLQILENVLLQIVLVITTIFLSVLIDYKMSTADAVVL